MTAMAPTAPRPWLHMWLQPRATVRGILSSSSLGKVLLLAAGSGAVQSFVQGYSTHVGNRGPVPGILIVVFALVIGSVWGLLQLHVVAGALYLVGKWTGAPASFSSVRTALAWAAVPQTAVLPIWVGATLIFGRFLYAEPQLALANMPVALLAQALVSIATFICAVWWLALQVLVVAEVQRVSAWRSLGHFALGGLMLAVVVLIIIVPIIASSRR